MDSIVKKGSKIIKSLGLVFGDIGTSPIYTITAIFLIIKPSPEHIFGILSLIFWTLTILVSIQYVWLAMSLSRKGEGGTIVLKEILIPLLKSKKKIRLINFCAFIGISLLIGDGVITPAISILSAVEGSRLIPMFQNIPQVMMIITAGIIAILLFMFQKKGTEKVAGTFGPIMLIWFLALLISGLFSLLRAPEIIYAINPYFALQFLFSNGLLGFFILSEVILCATGGEALYADMGHLSRKPITFAWYFVFFALVINYFGQGAFLLINPTAKNILFEMIFHESFILYIPFLLLSIVATVIASQAMISGMFSIVYQGIATHIMPLFKVEYTSDNNQGQIYIGAVNWFLLGAILFIMIIFKESNKLAAAYGFAVTGTMVITAFLMTIIFYLKKKYVRSFISILVGFVAVSFFVSNLYKIPHGGFWSIIIAIIPLAIILIYTYGQKYLYLSLQPMDFIEFIKRFREVSAKINKIQGTALFFVRNINKIPPYVTQTMFINNIIYEDNIFISIIRRNSPFGVKAEFKNDIYPGIRIFEIYLGYMEVDQIANILAEAGIKEKAIFYGIEDIYTTSFIWKIFVFIKKITPAYVQFYKLPVNKLHGVMTRVEL